MKSNDIFNETTKLCAIEKQIEYYTNLEYSQSNCHLCNNVPKLSIGLDEEDFNEVKQKLISLLQEKYNQKLKQITSMADSSKYN